MFSFSFWDQNGQIPNAKCMTYVKTKAKVSKINVNEVVDERGNKTE
jgi:hypothetical protein